MIRLNIVKGEEAAVQPTDAFWRRLLNMVLNPAIVLACAIAVAILWLVTLQRIEFEREQAIEAAMKSNANLTIAFEQQVVRLLQSAEQMAAFVREQYLISGQDIELDRWIKERVIREAIFNTIVILNEQGKMVSSSRDMGEENYANRDFFLEQRHNLQGGLFIDKPVLGPISGRWQVPMSLRIAHPDGRFAGVVVMAVDLSNFSEFYHQTNLGDRGLMELVGLNGVVFERKIGLQESYALEVKKQDWFKHHISMPVGDFVDDGTALDGVVRIVSHRIMRDYPLMVMIGVSYDDELLPVRQRQISYFVAAGIATTALLTFTILLLWVLARQRVVANALQASEALFRATFNQAAMGIAHIAPNGRILGANEKFCRMLGYNEETLLKRTVYDLGGEQDKGKLKQFIELCLSSNAKIFPQEIERTYQRSDGSLLWVCEALGVVRDARGRPEFLVAVTQDITARRELEERLSYDALHDALTCLPNRVLFQERLAKVLAAARRHEVLAAVLYMDLDGFKDVNDNYGHAAGDALLKQVAERLENIVREEDTVARLGGDEFGIVLASLSREGDCRVVAGKVLTALSVPFQLEEGLIYISASIGAAVFPVHGTDASTLVAHADGAMYAAKYGGKNRFCNAPLQE